MTEKVIISGSGGQGALTIGWIMALAVMFETRKPLGAKEYGPAMRGQSANCTVIVSEKEIGSPVIRHPDSVVVMNKPSLDRFGPRVKPGGLIVINKSLADWDFSREDVEILEVRATEIAEELGDKKGQATNMVMLGAYLKKKELVSFENIVKALNHFVVLKEKKWPQNVMELNEKALQRGWDSPRCG